MFVVCVPAWNSADKFTPSAQRVAVLEERPVGAVATELGGPSVSDPVPAAWIGRGRAWSNIQ